MPAVTKRQLKLLEPFLHGAQPHDGKNGREWDLHCPLHGDNTRSAQLNLDLGVWKCQACGAGGRVAGLIRQRDNWILPSAAPTNHEPSASNGQAEVITEARIAGWVEALHANEEALEELKTARGLEDDTIEAYEVGWDPGRRVYTIPVRGPAGEIWNVRRYNMNPPEGERKMKGAFGLNSPRLYPIQVLTDDNPDEIIVCEGEWDALLTIQNGFYAVTRTAAASVWDAAWGEYFEGKTVYLIHDCDDAGATANRKVARALERVASEVRVVQLPYPHAKKHGKDLTDYWLEGHSDDEFQELLGGAGGVQEDPEELDPADASVLDSFDARSVGKPLRLTVTIKGVRAPGYSVPKKVEYTCTRDAGTKCATCPLNAAGGQDELTIEASDPTVLEFLESTKGQVGDILRMHYGGIPRCSKLVMDVQEYQAVEILYARPSVEHVNGSSEDYVNMKITSVGRHDTRPNNTVQIVGALQPDPRKQNNEFQAWEVNRLKTSLDQFELNTTAIKRMKRFRPREGQTPLERLEQIAEDLAKHVTRIYGRPEMHMAMDLVFHSALAFDFAGSRVERGWLELLVVGDTRTGKSEAAQGLVRHYNAGEIVQCESASIAGIVGGLQQYGSGKEWAINWGAIPLNDRRLVVLDEVSALSPDAIASMSDVRSRGVAQLTKIQTEATPARTRLIWTGNPRDGNMAGTTYGVQQIMPLIGQPEDVARFDLAMTVALGEVDPHIINAIHSEGRQKFNSATCNTLVRWVWSRTPDQIKWAAGAEDAVMAAATEMGSMYIEDPPLVQVANVRIKIARTAVAMAARLFSTDRSYENIIVRKAHVKAAVEFMHRLYSMPGFGYYDLSTELIADRQEAQTKARQIKRYLAGRQGLAKFLRNNALFKRQDLEEIMNVPRDEANGIINTLWEARMVTKEPGTGRVKVQPALHELLRGIKE